MKTVLVTGAKGQVGQALQRNNDKTYVIHFLDKIACDITNTERVNAVLNRLKPDVVINTAAYTAVDNAEDDRESAFVVNAKGPEILAQACQQHNATLIHLSTDYVFAGDTGKPFTETDTTNPLGVYGESKLAGEQAVAQHCKQHLVIRLSGIFDLSGHNFVKTILRLAKTRDTLTVVDDQVTCPTPANAVATLLYQLLATIEENPAWGVYHFAAEPPVSWYGFAKTILAKAQSATQVIPIKTKDFPTKAKRPLYSVLNGEKIQTTFNITLPTWESELTCLINPETV